GRARGRRRRGAPGRGGSAPVGRGGAGVGGGGEAPVVPRGGRFPTVPVHADPRAGLPSQLFNRVRSKIEAIELPPGYTLEWGGEHEDSARARAALARPIPFALALMVIIVVALFNSFRTTAAIWLTMPLAIIGVTTALLL